MTSDWQHKLIRKYDNNLFMIIIVLMFSVELTSYINQWIDKSISQIILYSVVIFSMILFSRRNKGEIYKHNIFWPILYFYLLLLLIRIIIDFVIPNKGFFLYKTPATILFFYLCPILIPSIFFRFYHYNFNIKKTTIFIGIILIACIISSLNDIFSGNAVRDNDGRYETAVFSIAFGQYSTSLTLIGFYLLKLRNSNKFEKIFSIIFLSIGFIGVLFSGSRGPFIALVACICLSIVVQIRNVDKLIILGSVLCIIVLFSETILIGINEHLKEFGIDAFDRVVNTLFSEDGLTNHTSSRDTLYEEAWDLFLDKPLFGNSYLIPGKIYVHNIIIEQFMATGLFGGCAFIILNIIALTKSIKIIRIDHSYSIIPLLYIQYFIYGCLSVTILALFPFWLFLFLTINKSDSTNICKNSFR